MAVQIPKVCFIPLWWQQIFHSSEEARWQMFFCWWPKGIQKGTRSKWEYHSPLCCFWEKYYFLGSCHRTYTEAMVCKAPYIKKEIYFYSWCHKGHDTAQPPLGGFHCTFNHLWSFDFFFRFHCLLIPSWSYCLTIPFLFNFPYRYFQQQLQDLSMLQRNLSPFNVDWQNAPTRTSPSIMMSYQLPMWHPGISIRNFCKYYI